MSTCSRVDASVHVLLFAVALAPVSPLLHADEATQSLNEVIVTASRMRSPLVVETDPRQPRQPLPAQDGADYLKTIPGFAVIRKGGTSGDPLFRGMAASRVNMLLDGEVVLGGCGMRMDPPTAYVYPEAFDRIVVVKGPQTVLHGPGNSAATVSFESKPPAFDEQPWQAHASALAASAGRSDLVADLAAGGERAFARVNATRAEADDYADGAGVDVHSAYERWSTQATLGWRPDTASLIELKGALSDGHAAYADRSMDGAKFARENLGLRFGRDFGSGMLRRLEGQAYYNYVDHVMDNYSLRTFVPSAMMPGPSASNPDRRTIGGRVAAEMQTHSGLAATLGVDYQDNRHRTRSTMNEISTPYEAMARVADAEFTNAGLFGEATLPLTADQRVVAGLRADRWRAHDARASIPVGMMTSVPNPTADERRETTLLSGFARYEHDVPRLGTTLYGGLGHVERFPDYWELIGTGRESATSPSAFLTRPERTTQLDIGVVHRRDRLELSLSGFASRIDDYILIESNVRKGMRTTSISRNVDASTLGAEADAAWQLNQALRLTGTLAYTLGTNRTDDGPLAQMPPLELRAGAEYSRGAWHGGLLVRLVADQDRVAVDQGNVVGQDIGPSAGFAIVSANAAWQPRKGLLVSVGVDNLFDKLYAEHLSRGGATLAGYTQTTRVNEPGRTFWMKIGLDLR